MNFGTQDFYALIGKITELSNYGYEVILTGRETLDEVVRQAHDLGLSHSVLQGFSHSSIYVMGLPFLQHEGLPENLFVFGGGMLPWAIYSTGGTVSYAEKLPRKETL